MALAAVSALAAPDALPDPSKLPAAATQTMSECNSLSVGDL